MSFTPGSEFIMARLLPFSGTLAEWTAANPVPKQGELVIEVGTPMMAKIGDGTTAYLSLPYITGGAGTPESLQDVLNLGNVASDDGSPNVGNFTLKATSTSPIQSNVFPGRIILIDNISSVNYRTNGFVYNRVGSTPITVVGFLTPTLNRTINFPDKSGTIAMLSDITAAGALQGVLNAGNTAVVGGPNVASIILQDLSGNQSVADQTGIAISQSGIAYAGLNNPGSGGGNLYLKDQSSIHKVFVSVSSITGDRTVLLPDEGAGGGIADTLVIHTTKDAITVTNGTLASQISTTGFGVTDSAGNTMDILKDRIIYVGASSFEIAILFPNPAGSNKILNVPDQNGTLDIKDTYALTTNADYIPTSSKMFIELCDGITANRNIVLPTGNAAGDQMVFANLNTTGFAWAFSGGATCNDLSGSAVTTLTNLTSVTIRWNGSQWRKL